MERILACELKKRIVETDIKYFVSIFTVTYLLVARRMPRFAKPTLNAITNINSQISLEPALFISSSTKFNICDIRSRSVKLRRFK